MTFGDFVEKVTETPICGELKQRLDKLYEFYEKDPEKLAFCLMLLNIFLSIDSIEQIAKGDGNEYPYESQESESKRYAELAKSYVQGLCAGLAESENEK